MFFNLLKTHFKILLSAFDSNAVLFIADNRHRWWRRVVFVTWF